MTLRESSSSDDECFQPFGFDPSAFRRQRSEQVPQVAKPKPSAALSTLDYFALLKRAIHILQTKNCRSDIIKLPLDVKREGMKTSINIRTIAEAIRRDQPHLILFVLNELLTTGSVNMEGRLLLKGNFIKQQIQDVLRDYVGLYVVCKSCESLDTVLMKENKLCFVRCRGCGSSRTVANLKEGTMARKERRR